MRDWRIVSAILFSTLIALASSRAFAQPPAQPTEAPPSEESVIEEQPTEAQPAAQPAPPTPVAQPAPATAAPTPEQAAGRGFLQDEQAITEEQIGVEETRDSSSPWEDPREGYWFLGAFYRHVFLPEFMLNIFFDRSTSTNNPGVGAEVTYRKKNFDIIGSVWWQGYSGEGPFLGKGDPDIETEFNESSLSVIYAGATFLWSIPLSDIFAFEYGAGVALGYVIGDLERTEAYPSTGEGSVDGYARCNGPNDPEEQSNYCAPTRSGGPTDPDGEDGEHYGVLAQRWTDGGSVPNLFLWISVPHLALRIKPIHQVMMRIETGFSTGGFFLGASTAYGF